MWLKPNAGVSDILSIWQYALTVDGYHGHGTKSRVSGVGLSPVSTNPSKLAPTRHQVRGFCFPKSLVSLNGCP